MIIAELSHVLKKKVEIMDLVLLILSGIGGIVCLYLAIDCLLAASQENMLTDIKDVDIGETIV